MKNRLYPRDAQGSAFTLVQEDDSFSMHSLEDTQGRSSEFGLDLHWREQDHPDGNAAGVVKAVGLHQTPPWYR